MQYSVIDSQTKIESMYSLLSRHNENRGYTPSHVAETVTKAANDFTPWYAKVKNQKLNLSKAAAEKISLIPKHQYQDIVNENADFWRDLMIMALKNNLINEHEIGEFLECEQGTLQQVDAAESIADRVLDTYKKNIKEFESNIRETVSVYGVNADINNDLEEWANNLRHSNWTYDLSINDYDGNGCSEFSQIGIKIEHDSQLSVLCFNLDDYSPSLASLTYKVINLLAKLAWKSNSIDLIDVYGDLEELTSKLKSIFPSQETIIKISKFDPDSIENFMLTAPEALVDYLEQNSIENESLIVAAQLICATDFTPWYSEECFDKCLSPSEIAGGLLKELKTLRLNCLKDESEKVQVIGSVLQAIQEHSNDCDNSMWELNSDTPIDCFSYVSFGTEMEEQNLTFENECRQSISECGSVRLNLAKQDAGLKAIENLVLGNYGLLKIAGL